MTSPVKFTFDTNFDGGVKTDFEQEVDRLQHLVEDTKAKAMQDGIAKGRAEMLESIEQQAIGAMDVIQHSCQSLIAERRKLEASAKRDSVQLATLIAGRLAPAILNARPADEIEDLIRNCFIENYSEKRLVIRISDCLTEQLEPRIMTMQSAAGFEGKVLVISDPHLPQSDCYIEWADGGIERDGNKLMEDIETTVKRYIDHIYNPDKITNEDTENVYAASGNKTDPNANES